MQGHRMSQRPLTLLSKDSTLRSGFPTPGLNDSQAGILSSGLSVTFPRQDSGLGAGRFESLKKAEKGLTKIA
jgi:hypothetical protein